MNQTAYKFAAQVGAAGKLEVTVPVPAGTSVEVVVLAPSSDEFADLVNDAQTSLGFWSDSQGESTEDIFAEMAPFMVDARETDDSREAIYTRIEGE